MTERKLTPEEIDELFDFCQKHYAPEYDLQVELVDHLASAIEEQWRTNPNIPFPVARINSFSQFGIFGFSKIKNQKQKELRRKYSRLLLNYTIDYLKLPKVLFTGTSFSLLFSCLRYLHHPERIMDTYFIIILVVLVYYHFYLLPRKYKIETLENKTFIAIAYLEERKLISASALQIPFISFTLLSHTESHILNQFWIALPVSITIILFSIILYISLVIIPTKIKQHLKEQYPQFVKA